MSSDIRHFILRSYGDPVQKQRLIEEAHKKRKASLDTFEKIYNTFGFDHHAGSDKAMELKVLKIIMVREGLLMTLRHLAEKSLRTNAVSGTNLLEVLSQIRESTLSYLEALILWRQSSGQHDGQPRPFGWEGRNYTLKIIHDLDFLAENALVTEALGLGAEQLYLNPLMLNNNLEDFNTWMEPYDRAAADTNGQTSDPAFETRLRLRLAERMLLQEMETTDDGSDIFITQHEAIMQHDGAFGQGLMVGSSALEEEEYGEPFDRRQTKSSDSASSSKAVGHSDPYSRGSGYSFGLSSGPASRTQSAPAPADAQALEFGHDFFTGRWMDNKAGNDDDFFYSEDGKEQLDEEGEEQQEKDVLFLENGSPRTHAPMATQADMIYRDDSEDELPAAGIVEDERSVGSFARSVRSIESVGDMDMRGLRSLALPPKCVMLAASSCVILLSGSASVPSDISWKAFLRLTKRINLSEAMGALDPLSVPAFKIIAIQPIVRQLLDEDALAKVHDMDMPVGTYSAVIKLIKWVQQFTTSAIKKQLKGRDISAKGKIALEPIPGSKKSRKAVPVEEAAPKAKFVIPKVKLELYPHHTELLENGAFANPLLLVLMTSTPSSSTSSLPMTNSASDSTGDAPRMVIKLYDSANSKEAVVHINMREHLLLKQEMLHKYGDKVQALFQPTSLQWWAQHAKHVVNVQLRSNGSLHASISKKAIDDWVVKTLNSSPPSRSSSAARPAAAASASSPVLRAAAPTQKPAPTQPRAMSPSSGNTGSKSRMKLVSSSTNKLPPTGPPQQSVTRKSLDATLLKQRQPGKDIGKPTTISKKTEAKALPAPEPVRVAAAPSSGSVPAPVPTAATATVAPVVAAVPVVASSELVAIDQYGRPDEAESVTAPQQPVTPAVVPEAAASAITEYDAADFEPITTDSAAADPYNDDFDPQTGEQQAVLTAEDILEEQRRDSLQALVYDMVQEMANEQEEYAVDFENTASVVSYGSDFEKGLPLPATGTTDAAAVVAEEGEEFPEVEE